MTSPTFAEKTKKTKITPINTFDYPSEEQGLIFDHVEGCKIREYLLALHTLIGGPQNILAASRVSGGRVIIFLASKEIVDAFQNKYGGFTVANGFVKTRKLKTPAVRIILSNVSPIIPNSVIENVLNESLGLKPISPISILRVSPTDDIFSHVISWRRQTYLPANTDLTKIPSTVTLTYAERSYRIFITAGDLTCFKCSEKGHKAENCPNNLQFADEEMEDTAGTLVQPEPTSQGSQLSNTDFPPLSKPEHQEKSAVLVNLEKFTNINPSQKRGPSTITTSTSSSLDHPIAEETMLASSDTDSQHTPKTKRKKNKKIKPNPEAYLKSWTLTPTEIEAITSTVNHIRLTKFPDCDFNAEKLIDFLPKFRGKLDKVQLAESFTKNLDHFQYFLEELKPQLETGSKRTITSICKALSKDTSLSDFSDS